MRFSNILKLPNLNVDKIWTAVKKRKSDLKFDTRCGDDGLYYDSNSGYLVQQIEWDLGVRDSLDQINEDMTEKHLKTSAEMFIYLHICPGDFSRTYSKEAKEQWFKSWFVFYNDLLENHPPDRIMLTLNRLMKNTDNTGKKRNRKIFQKLATLLEFKYEYIQNMLPGGGRKDLFFENDKVTIPEGNF